MSSLACSVPELLIARIAAETSTMRVGAGGIMLPNHAPLRVAEEFRTLEAMFPGRIDLGLGRAPGTDGTTAWALRRSREAVVNDEFVTLAAQLFAFLDAGGAYPEDHPFASVMAAPRVPSPPQIWMLGSSGYGGAFAAVNGLPTAFAHHINPAPAVASLRSYRREFQPSERSGRAVQRDRRQCLRQRRPGRRRRLRGPPDPAVVAAAPQRAAPDDDRGSPRVRPPTRLRADPRRPRPRAVRRHRGRGRSRRREAGRRGRSR